MGAYVDAYGRFRVAALNLHGGPPDTPDMKAGFAAAALRYLKDTQAKLKDDPCEPWEGVGEGIAKTPFASMVPPDVRDRFWSWARCVCQQADVENLPFAAVHPTPEQDYKLLQKKFGLGTGSGPVTTPDTPVPADEAEAEWGKKKDPPPSKVNTGLFLFAVILIAALAHRTRS